MRGLSAAGFEVVVAAASSAQPAPSHWSRHAAARVLVPHPLVDELGFVAALENAIATQRCELLIAGSDASLLAVSRARERLAAQGALLGLPQHDRVERAVDKLTLVSASARHGLSCPATLACSGPSEGIAAARELGFPVIVKPRSSVIERDSARTQVGSFRVADEAGLSAALGLCGDRYLIQRLEQGPVASYAGVRAAGELLGEAFSKYRRTWYPDAGNVSFSETFAVPGELRARVERLLDELGWEGMFELELIERADGGWAAIDLNPRPYGSLALAIGAGANLPAMWCRHLLGWEVAPARARPGVRYRWEDADLRHALWQLRRRRLPEAMRALRIRRHVVHPYFRLRDPGPFAARMIYLGRATAIRLRSRVPARALQDVRDLDVAGSRAPARTQAHAAPVVIIGAGPYGLAAAAYVRSAGVPTRSFGEPLQFWRNNMPAGMLLRSPRRATHIADPNRELSIDSYELDTGRPTRKPTLRLEEFIDYGTWFQRRAVSDLDTRRVSSVVRANGHFALTLEDGEEVIASRVVVAAGLTPFAATPQPFAALPRSLVSHSSEHDDLAGFRGKRLVVVGAGQSALESAALLREHDALAEVLVRAPAVTWLADDTQPRASAPWRRIPPQPPPTGVGGRVTGWIAAAPDAYRHVPGRLQPWVSYRCIRPAGSGWLRPRLVGVPITCGRSVVHAEASDGQVRLVLDDRSERIVDHVLLGTGYEVDVTRYAFLAPVAGQLQTVAGYPRLGPGLESTVPGLHFLGAPAAHSFGPIMRFVVGTWFAAPALALHVSGRPQPRLRLSF